MSRLEELEVEVWKYEKVLDLLEEDIRVLDLQVEEHKDSIQKYRDFINSQGLSDLYIAWLVSNRMEE